MYKENNLLEISIIFNENKTHRESKLNPESISLKPSRSSSWILRLQNGTFFLKMFDSSKDTQAIQIYTSMQKIYDSEMSVVRTYVFDEVRAVGNTVKAEEHESVSTARSSLNIGTMEVRNKALNKKKEIEDKFAEKVKTYENPDMAAKFLVDFVFDIRRKIESWLDLEEAQILKEISGIIKRKM